MSPTKREIKELVRWAISIARVLAKLKGQLQRKDDVIEAALHGLNDALRTTDRTRVEPFKAYARVRIVGEVLDVIGHEKRRAAWELLLEDAGQESPVRAAVEARVLETCVDGDAEILRREAEQRLRRAVAQLAPADQQLLALRGVDGLPWNRVAATLGIPESTARDHFQKLRARLRSALLEEDEPRYPSGPRLARLPATPRRRE
jgi:RNA polymerase sigma factor (sigma-70 family)